jgi:hypothetical protein
MDDNKGILGAVTTATSAFVSWLPAINEIVQIIAGLIAIVCGLVTIRHYLRKDKK